MKVLALSTTSQALSDTPFVPGREAVAVNFGASSVTITDTDASTTIATVPASAMVMVESLPANIKSSAACYLLGGV